MIQISDFTKRTMKIKLRMTRHIAVTTDTIGQPESGIVKRVIL